MDLTEQVKSILAKQTVILPSADLNVGKEVDIRIATHSMILLEKWKKTKKNVFVKKSQAVGFEVAKHCKKS